MVSPGAFPPRLRCCARNSRPMDRKTRPGGIKSREGLPSNRLWPLPSRAPIQISRVRTHAEATNTAREGANHWRRPESAVPIWPAICVSYRAARRAVELDERRTARRLGAVPVRGSLAHGVRPRTGRNCLVSPSACDDRRGSRRRSAESASHVHGADGGEPADRSKVAVPDEPREDPTDRFFN